MSSVTSRLIESEIDENSSIIDEDIIKNVAGTTYGGLKSCVYIRLNHLTKLPSFIKPEQIR